MILQCFFVLERQVCVVSALFGAEKGGLSLGGRVSMLLGSWHADACPSILLVTESLSSSMSKYLFPAGDMFLLSNLLFQSIASPGHQSFTTPLSPLPFVGLQLVSPEISSEVPNPNEISGGRSPVSFLLSPVSCLLSPVSCTTHSLALDASESVPINGFLGAFHCHRCLAPRNKATSTTRLVRHPVASTVLAAISPARLGIPMSISFLSWNWSCTDRLVRVLARTRLPKDSAHPTPRNS